MDALAELKWRGLIYAQTESLEDRLAKGPITAYNGFDPTAPSLHVGHLIPALNLARLMRLGHRPIAVVGGATGMVGDPSGKSDERNLLDLETIRHNAECIYAQLRQIIGEDAQFVNNYDWLSEIGLLDFLRTTAKRFTVNYMIAKESVKKRIESEHGISFTEFSYMLLQAHDFLHLYENYGCELQCGGSDQWGNIVAGVDLIRRKHPGSHAHGMVYPLLLTHDGQKFGKTERGSVWLDPEMTAPYQFYQFWYNVPDASVIDRLKTFTWLGEEQILALQDSTVARPEKREAQTVLAKELTRMIHGETAVDKAVRASQALFGGSLDGLTASEIAQIFADVPSAQIPKDELAGEGMSLIDLAARVGAASSKSEARRLLQQNGLYVNNLRPESDRVHIDQAIEGRFIALRRGAKQYYLVELV
ncbi:MAG: tyrosine--tRNA ligase [Armatimonadetes bacterium]|nr:tyrosine--tRNA ligase [Armatimonadota bacterium]